MSKEVIVRRTPPALDVHAQIDNKKLAFNAAGIATHQVESGMHALIYFLVAAPGTEFKMAIEAPPECVWSREHRVPSDGVTVGTKKFQVKE